MKRPATILVAFYQGYPAIPCSCQSCPGSASVGMCQRRAPRKASDDRTLSDFGATTTGIAALARPREPLASHSRRSDADRYFLSVHQVACAVPQAHEAAL